MSHIQGESIDDIQLEAQDRMEKTVEDLRREMGSLRTGRASVHLLDTIRVDYYGSMTPLSQMANLSAPDPSLLQVQPWDTSQIGAIEKAIQTSDLGLNPQNDGKIIRLPIPPLTQERRQQFVKQLHQMTEKHRVAVRNLRRDANDAIKKLEKDKVVSEDESRHAQDEIQKLTDDTIKMLDATSAAKEKEIMEIG
ncbi:MAG: ribosome recycling factor [Bryobacterales bacterium]|nr:ribosome recycling factor [Acidobacteriota bacterium]MCB9384790.1 ribosome recycling factor [Bryobacterales bacterium]